METRNELLGFVFSSVKTHIDDLVRQADKYTKDMNEDFEHFFCWYAEDMYKTQRELSCYRALKVVYLPVAMMM